MISAALAQVVEGKSLSFDEARDVVKEIFSGGPSPALVAALLVAWRMKGESVDEIAGAAQAMREVATKISLPDVPVVVDTCGTGGDRQGSFNVSTAAALVVAGAGWTVAKHGNRSISSQCGSADVLEALGVHVSVSPAVTERCLKEIGLGFMFAPLYHPAMKHALPVRRELGLRTVFNLLGPLTNPAGANAQVIGVYSESMVPVVARVLARLGVGAAWVVHGAGHDEITLFGKTIAALVDGKKVVSRVISPEDFGLKRQHPTSLRGGDKNANAAIIRRVLAGEPGPERDAVVANAAAAIWVAGRAEGKSDIRHLKDARFRAEQSIDSGAARMKLDRLAALTGSEDRET